VKFTVGVQVIVRKYGEVLVEAESAEAAEELALDCASDEDLAFVEVKERVVTFIEEFE